MGYLNMFVVMILSVSSFILNSRHVLGSLIILEFMVIYLFMCFMVKTYSNSGDSSGVIIMFTGTVASAGVGLSALVALTRSHGQDYYTSMRCLW